MVRLKPCSASDGPATRSVRSPGRDVPDLPAGPARRGRRHVAHAARADRTSRHTGQPARHPRPADRRGDGPRADRRRGVVRHRTPQRPVRDAASGRHTTRRSTCWPAAIRRTSSPSCVPGSCGTATPARSPAGPVPSDSPSPVAAPSPTAACSRSISPQAQTSPVAAARWASSTRRWSTSRASTMCSPSARRAGGSRRSRTIASSSRRLSASPRACRSGRATQSVGPTSSAKQSEGSCARPPTCRPPSLPSVRPALGLGRAGLGQPRRLSARPEGGDGSGAVRSHPRGRAGPRRAR